MGFITVPIGSSARLFYLIVAGSLLTARVAFAFPVTDESNPSIVSNPAPPTDSDLRHQLQLQSGIGAAASGGGWTFLPALSADEFFTDNVLDTANNRRWDLVTLVTPSIGVIGDLPNAQVNFRYSPQFRLDATTPQENSVTQQLIGTANITLIPDQLYVDARAYSGASPLFGGFGALTTGLTPGNGQFGQGVGTQALPKDQTAQNSSLSIAPYLLHRFGDTGTAKLGYEFNETSISQQNTVVPLFYPTGGLSQHSVTNQGVAQFETGERFAPFRDLLLANASLTNGTGVSNDATQDTISNELGYAINRVWGVYGELGYEKLRFGGVPPVNVDDATWGFGVTYTPNTDSQITIGYGHKNGVTGMQFSGYYALTPRTRVSARYSTGLQTDLQQLQSQLDLTALDQNGNAVDAQTGAPLFGAVNGLGVQSGLFRAKNLSATASTVLDRDQINATILWSQNTTIATDTAATTPFNPSAPPVGSTSEGLTGIITWVHQINENLTLNTAGSYGVSHVTGGPTGGGTGQQTSVGATISLQYMLSQTLSTSVRYSYFERTSPLPDQTVYQNLFLIGITKQF